MGALQVVAFAHGLPVGLMDCRPAREPRSDSTNSATTGGKNCEVLNFMGKNADCLLPGAANEVVMASKLSALTAHLGKVV